MTARLAPETGPGRSMAENTPGALRLAVIAGTRLALRHLQAEARTSRAGLMWIVISPVLYVGMFMVLRAMVTEHGIRVETGAIDPGLYAVIGVLVFQAWFEAIDLQSGAFSNNAAFIKNVGVDVRVFFVASLVRSLITSGIRYVLALACIAFFAPASFGIVPALGLLAVMLLVVLNGHLLGFALSPISALYRDVKQALSAISLVLLVASGAFAVPSAFLEGWTWWAFALNPVASGIDAARAVALGAPLSLGVPFLVWCLCLPVLAWIAFSFVAASRPIIAERL